MNKNTGTLVTVKDLFKSLPVRLAEFKRSHKTQYQKCVSLLQQYAVISTHCKLTVSNNQGENLPFNDIFRTSQRVPFAHSAQWLTAFGQNIQQVLGR